MNKRIDFTKLGVLYMYQTSFGFMQDAYGNALAAMAQGLGDKWVLAGCVDNGTTVSNGVIIVGDDIIPFTGGAKAGLGQVKVTTTVGKELYDDGNLKDCYYTKTAALVSIGDFAYTDLKRLPAGGVLKNINDLQTVVKQAINYEDTVILKGGVVSAINTVASTCNISAGSALFDGTLVEFAAQVGITYPCYLLPNGNFSNSIPGSGLYIRYNPHTSQFYKDVLKRAVTPTGEIKMFETLSDRFDGSGVGRWEMTGFSLMAAMQGRTPIGLWYDGVAVANVTDANYNTAGNQGGEKAHTLTPGEFTHKHTEVWGVGTTDDSTPAMANDFEKSGGGGSGFYRSKVETNRVGNSDGTIDPHNNVQPYTVVVYAKRT